MFTAENTTGYSRRDLAFLNAALERRLSEVDPEDADAGDQVEKSFADNIAQARPRGLFVK